VADTITEIDQRSRGTYGRRRVRAALLADYDMNVNLKLVNSPTEIRMTPTMYPHHAVVPRKR
jgi:HTH-like domain